MIRLTILLMLAIYVVLIVVPPSDHGENVAVTRDAGQNWLVAMIYDAEAVAQRPPSDRTPSSVALRASLTDQLIETDDGYAIETADGERLDIAAIINPANLRGDDTQTSIASVSLVQTPAVDVATSNAPAAAPVSAPAEIWRVAASAVNFREGPSTNTRVLTSLRSGDEVEFLAEAPDNWARLRVVSTGLEGYMAAQFLEPAS